MTDKYEAAQATLTEVNRQNTALKGMLRNFANDTRYVDLYHTMQQVRDSTAIVPVFAPPSIAIPGSVSSGSSSFSSSF